MIKVKRASQYHRREEKEKDEKTEKSIALVFVHEDAQMERKQINLRSITDVTLVQVDAAFAQESRAAWAASK